MHVDTKDGNAYLLDDLGKRICNVRISLVPALLREGMTMWESWAAPREDWGTRPRTQWPLGDRIREARRLRTENDVSAMRVLRGRLEWAIADGAGEARLLAVTDEYWLEHELAWAHCLDILSEYTR